MTLSRPRALALIVTTLTGLAAVFATVPACVALYYYEASLETTIWVLGGIGFIGTKSALWAAYGWYLAFSETEAALDHAQAESLEHADPAVCLYHVRPQQIHALRRHIPRDSV